MRNYCDGGEAILEAFRNLGVDYIVSSPGSEWAPVWEALARQKLDEKPGPIYLNCSHESLAVAMALGYTRMTGRLQAVLLHAGAGLMHGMLAIHSALLAEAPMIVLSGESLSYGEDPALDIEPQWYRFLSIVGGPQRLVEPAVKWATQVGSPFTLYESVLRAGEMARRQPMGPIYLDVPLEVMLHEWTPPAKARKVPPPRRTQAAPAEIERVAKLLIEAERPVCLTGACGRDPQAFIALVELAELLAMPVTSRVASYANFPTEHPLYLPGESESALGQADLILLVEARAPWYPPSRHPMQATIVAVSENPFSPGMVYQSLQADSYLEGDVAASLRMLAEAVRSASLEPAKLAERRRYWESEGKRHASALRAAEVGAAGSTSINPLALCGALREVMPPDTVYVEETITHFIMLQEHLRWDRPGSYFRATGGLGEGLGLALGSKLAAPERMVVALIGDGSFLYNPMVQAFAASKDHGLPILVIVFNNGGYRSMRRSHVHHYPDGVALGAGIFHGVRIDGPDYAELGRPFGFYGERVERPGQLRGAMQNALAAVKQGRTAILNVVLSE